MKDEESSITTDITDALEMDVEIDMDMKKKEDESFGTKKNLKDAESIRTGITDALEIDMEMETDNDPNDLKCGDLFEMGCEIVHSFLFFVFFLSLYTFIFYRLSKIGDPYLVMVLMAIITTLCCFCCARYHDIRRATITEPND